MQDAQTLLLAYPLRYPGTRARVLKSLASDDPNDRSAAVLAIELFGTRRIESALWSNVSFQDARYYPYDVRLRHAALSSLVDVELNSRITAAADRDAIQDDALVAP